VRKDVICIVDNYVKHLQFGVGIVAARSLCEQRCRNEEEFASMIAVAVDHREKQDALPMNAAHAMWTQPITLPNLGQEMPRAVRQKPRQITDVPQRTPAPSAAAPPDRSRDPARRLRAAILAGEFLPNQRLIEVEIAEFLGVQRAHVRMAFARLEQEGLVQIEPNRGARVRVITEAEAIEIAEVRSSLETLAARMAAERITPAGAQELKALVAGMREAARNEDLLRYSSINGSFHAAIRKISAHQTTARILENLKSQIVRFQFRAIMLAGRASRSLGEHEAIAEAICAGDPDAAGEAMRRHMDRVTEALRRAIAAHTRETF
jgi:DNA-binding GntR family transcriptional regulator